MGESLFASLPWYDAYELRGMNDALWKRLGRELRRMDFTGVPHELERGLNFGDQWQSGHLLFSQACGYNVVLTHADELKVLATPCYRAPGCSGALYSSFVVVRDDHTAGSVAELRGARAVVNDATSHSGTNALRGLVASLQERGRFFSAVAMSGSHEASLAMLRHGEADVAAVDCVTYALLERYRADALSGLRVLARTAPAPAPPFVTWAGFSDDEVARLRAALAAVIADPELTKVRAALLLDGIAVLDPDDYHPLAELEAEAHEMGYFELPGRLAA